MSIVHDLRRYLFPRRSIRDQIPLSPRRFSSNNQPWGEIPQPVRAACLKLRWAGVAHTDADALRLLKRFEGLSPEAIINRERKPRRFLSTLKMAWKRLKRIW
jgi:hypothetical protein